MSLYRYTSNVAFDSLIVIGVLKISNFRRNHNWSDTVDIDAVFRSNNEKERVPAQSRSPKSLLRTRLLIAAILDKLARHMGSVTKTLHARLSSRKVGKV